MLCPIKIIEKQMSSLLLLVENCPFYFNHTSMIYFHQTYLRQLLSPVYDTLDWSGGGGSHEQL